MGSGGDTPSVLTDSEQVLSTARAFLAFRKRYPLSVITGTMVAHLWFPDEQATLCGVKVERLDQSWTMLEGCPRCGDQARQRLVFSSEELARRIAAFEDPLRTWLTAYYGLNDGHARSLRQVAALTAAGRPAGTVMSRTWKALRAFQASAEGRDSAPDAALAAPSAGVPAGPARSATP